MAASVVADQIIGFSSLGGSFSDVAINVPSANSHIVILFGIRTSGSNFMTPPTDDSGSFSLHSNFDGGTVGYEVWVEANASVGDHLLGINPPGPSSSVPYTALVFVVTDAQQPTAEQDSGTGTSVTLPAPESTGVYVDLGVAVASVTATKSDTDQTSMQNAQPGGGSGVRSFSSYATAGTVTAMGWTLSTSKDWAHVLLYFADVSAGSTEKVQGYIF